MENARDWSKSEGASRTVANGKCNAENRFIVGDTVAPAAFPDVKIILADLF